MKTVVIGDKDQEILNSLKLFLKEYYRIITVKDNFELMKKVKEEPVDLVLSDLKLFHIGSVSDIKEIKKLKPSIPLVLMYVYFNDSREIELNLRNYVDAVIHKPFDVENVRILIDKLTKKANKMININKHY